MSRKPIMPKSIDDFDWTAFDAMTDEDIHQAVADDPDAAPIMTPGMKFRVVVPPLDIGVRAIREATGLSQAAFAARYGFTKRAVENWEQGIRSPDRSARVLLWLIERNPDAVSEALAELGSPA